MKPNYHITAYTKSYITLLYIYYLLVNMKHSTTVYILFYNTLSYTHKLYMNLEYADPDCNPFI